MTTIQAGKTEPQSPMQRVMDEFQFTPEERIQFQALVLSVMIGSEDEVVNGLYDQALEVFGYGVLRDAIQRFDKLNASTLP